MAFVDFINTTTRRRRPFKTAVDVTYDKRVVMELVRKKGTIKTGVGGVDTIVPLETSVIGDAAGTSVGSWDGGNQALTYADDDIIEGMHFDQKYLFCVTFIVDNEKLRNKGMEQAVSIIDARVNAAKKRLSLLMEQMMVSAIVAGTDMTGFPDYMNNTNAAYGGGLDLTNAIYGPKIVAVGAPIANFTLDHLNEAFTATQDGNETINQIISNPAFLQKIRSLVNPSQIKEKWDSTWQWGAQGLNWNGRAPVTASRYMVTDRAAAAIKRAYGFRMKDLWMEFAYGGDGIELEDWRKMSNTISTYALVVKTAVKNFCIDPHEQFEITWT